MKKANLFLGFLWIMATANVRAQHVSQSRVPAVVKAEFSTKYPAVKRVAWETENGNYEANWGGKSGEDTAVQFTPAGQFVEIVTAIPVDSLPALVADYVKTHYKKTFIKQASKGCDAAGAVFYEAEVKGKDLLFDQTGNFIKED